MTTEKLTTRFVQFLITIPQKNQSQNDQSNRFFWKRQRDPWVNLWSSWKPPWCLGNQETSSGSLIYPSCWLVTQKDFPISPGHQPYNFPPTVLARKNFLEEDHEKLFMEAPNFNKAHEHYILKLNQLTQNLDRKIEEANATGIQFAKGSFDVVPTRNIQNCT